MLYISDLNFARMLHKNYADRDRNTERDKSYLIRHTRTFIGVKTRITARLIHYTAMDTRACVSVCVCTSSILYGMLSVCN